jgi:hypothetical protein
MRKTRTIVAVTLLATALCADRAVTQAARASTPVETTAPTRSFAQRLTGSLRRVVPAVKLSPTRVEGQAPVVVVRDLSGGQTTVHAIRGDAFVFRLPPPLL